MYTGGPRAKVRVQAIATRKADGSKLDLRTLLEAEEGNLARLGDFITALSEHSRGDPGLKWIVPAKEEPSIDHDTALSIRITDFDINSAPTDNGFVRLSFQGGTGCSGQQLHARAEENLDQAEVHFRIPSGCRGTQVSMTAVLVDSNNVPLDPPVAETIIVNII
jgi:hypothetical protein